MTMTTKNDSKAEALAQVGRCAYESIRDMVAALECDYDRLEELRDERADLAEQLKDLEPEEDAALNGAPDADYDAAKACGRVRLELQEWDEKNGEELKKLTDAAGECKDADDARQRIEEDPLSVEVRSDWYTPGSPDGNTPGEFCILLSTGGPATRIIGELDQHGEPCRARLEVQDWFTPWTEHLDGVSMETLLTYSRCFVYTS
jgi:hypothetical protein